MQFVSKDLNGHKKDSGENTILNVGLFLIICLLITSTINNITVGVEMEMILFFNRTENV